MGAQLFIHLNSLRSRRYLGGRARVGKARGRDAKAGERERGKMEGPIFPRSLSLAFASAPP